MAGKSGVARRGAFYVSPLLIIMCAVFLCFGYYITIISYLVSVLYHECAHSLAAEWRGYKLNRFKLMPYGASVSGEYVCVYPKDELIIAAAGPLSNFIVALAGLALWWAFPITYPYTETLVMSSFFVGLMNLIPVFPLDGGRMLLAVLGFKHDKAKAYKTVKTVSIVVGSLFAMSGIVLMIISIIYGDLLINFSYITLTIFMLVSAVLPDNETKYQRLYSMAYSSERLKRGLQVRDIMVSEDKTLIELSKMLSGNHYTRFHISGDDFKVKRIITETELEEKMLVCGASEKVKSVDF